MHPSIVRNTLISPSGVDKILSLPEENTIYTSFSDILLKFQDIKKFASEIHTEIHLIKPILKILGYAYESKPKFFEESVKNPDVALFTDEQEKLKASQFWGTKEYFGRAIGLLQLKRYGRSLDKGIGGFYLEFENKIPVYQLIYILKNVKTPWGILTNGRNWILLKKPNSYEKKLIEIDIENALILGNEETLHLFFHIFSLNGLKNMLPEIIEDERKTLIGVLREKRVTCKNSISGVKKRIEIYPKLIQAYKELSPHESLPLTELFLNERGIKIEEHAYEAPHIINKYDALDIFTYLFVKKGYESNLNMEEIFLDNKNIRYTKEDLFKLKILDMTPGLGSMSSQIVEGLSYLSFVLPYRDKNTFVAEWEDEYSLKKYILEHILYGIERSHLTFDIMINILKTRFNSNAPYYKSGNPLIGMAIQDISYYYDEKDQMGLFNKNPKDLIHEFKEMYKLYFSLSDKIKEDVEIKNEMKARLNIYKERIRDVMDVITASHFARIIDNKKIRDMLFSLDSDETTWELIRKKNWFLESKEIASKHGFFHLEIDFPFLLHNAYDYIFVQPALSYIWEDEVPVVDATKAYIKRGMTYLKQEGKLIVCLEHVGDSLIAELDKSKKYEAEFRKGYIVISRKLDKLFA
ncbi:MAG: hypothetical protein NTX75_09930 [Proteobacteria bacterium]|nr:hypothetical protein [Pseudomonadota bacterium]